ncbi:histidine phosphatase family protein [Lutibacter sp. A80]|uniref:SixA phosphatase family protein n=1 Tax=Lutibacter sp. A80 TaxID=2918453 RepID=UPI001F06B767|nr:phosphoglycerate mutase family protein [Lutibacter sp. A80]UMB61482.1 histidine phosphatase family protein [Lutibacter sp. A80]
MFFKFSLGKFFLIISVLICSVTLNAQENSSEITTYYFIRHAEKNRLNPSNKNPNLKEKGVDRALNWSKTFKNIEFDYIFSTNYNRTTQTALPTAKSKNLEIQFYNPSDLYNEDFKTLTKGKTVLVVGHSNTTPKFVNKVLGEDKYPEIEDRNNSNLYIVTISENNKSTILLNIEI